VRGGPAIAGALRKTGSQAIFLPRVLGTAMGSWWKQYLPLLYIDS
jgi:hypothetical protein